VFGNIGWGEMVVLLVAALVILGPERLPGAVQWTSRSLRQARDYASGATSQLKQELGPEFDQLREPLSEISKMRGMTPRSAITKHLLDGDDSIFTGKFDRAAESAGAPQQPAQRQKPLSANEAPPIDPDAT
jgi:sec-independent protein translocase protein TatB